MIIFVAGQFQMSTKFVAWKVNTLRVIPFQGHFNAVMARFKFVTICILSPKNQFLYPFSDVVKFYLGM